MAADKGKRSKVAEKGAEESDHIDGELVLSIERLQEIQDEIEKVSRRAPAPFLVPISDFFSFSAPLIFLLLSSDSYSKSHPERFHPLFLQMMPPLLLPGDSFIPHGPFPRNRLRSLR